MPLVVDAREYVKLKQKRRPRRVTASRTKPPIVNAVRERLTAKLGYVVKYFSDEALARLVTMKPSDILAEILTVREKTANIFGEDVESLTQNWIQSVSDFDKKKLEEALRKSMGLEFGAILDTDETREAAQLMAHEASQLIKDLPQDYLTAIETAVLQNYQQIPLPENRSLAEEIQALTKQVFERCQLIAEDQTSKVHTAITQQRQVGLGIDSYIWRTSRDQRVVGDPSGLYPKPTKLHGNHYVREGQVFYWSDPPDDGHAGWPIRCRCYPEARIDPKKLVLI